MSNWMLRYSKPATDSVEGWERESLPLGNGFLGANVFGGVARERVQITENTLENEGPKGGLTNFAEVYVEFPHDSGEEYLRTLDIGDAEAQVRYRHNGVQYTRQYFASYPNRVLVMRFAASEKVLALTAKIEIPYLGDYSKTPGDGAGRTGEVRAVGQGLQMRGLLENYRVEYRGELRLIACDGAVTVSDAGIAVRDATEAVFLFACATNYELRPEVFLENDPAKKLRAFDPMPIVTQRLDDAAQMSWAALQKIHRADYRRLFGRVQLDLGETASDACTDELLAQYRDGVRSAYLEALYFQFGRYLLISSSRPGGMPANLQGIWNVHRASPWGSGYWYNINIQMNYWPAFSTNLAECFEPMVDFTRAFLPRAQKNASVWLHDIIPEGWAPGEGVCGWSIGTGSYPYRISLPDTQGGHSGPGTGGLTSKLFWEYYDFTRDENVLRHVTYPLLRGVSRFQTRTVLDYDGKLLAAYSASPEQMVHGARGGWKYYNTIGCAFDQQMIEENGQDFLQAAALLGEENEDTAKQRRQLDKYDAVQVGWDGQIKEYREEKFYGEIGEFHHRHISQLVALMPGTAIHMGTDAWMDAAKTTLNFRGDQSTGWALAHRMNAWARTGDGNRTHKLYRELLTHRTNDNLWDMHPPFQIDGNFGGCAAVAEMLLQSHDGLIRVLPSLPDCWASGKVSGLCARGAFEVDIAWRDHRAEQIVLRAQKGGPVRLHYPHLRGAQVTDNRGHRVEISFKGSHGLRFTSEPGATYTVTVPARRKGKPAPVTGLTADRAAATLNWDAVKGVSYSIHRAVDGDPCYTLIASDVQGGTFVDESGVLDDAEIAMYKVVPWKDGESGEGAWVTVNPATPLELARRKRFLYGIMKK